ncbi:predicted protein [Histoplasma capsulatum G186AR]|uniref:Uncharacterized protein n=1 Tax=Ajellomyces capsulatus (strain G186AR / H82 / ATCC MYA-2454 / RMSCC 2432) TaxID=447093 RepID=C0NG85_AJECG|nr:uncharacterized protein HCBG_01901 [Histoplasma capsulatum G186AR]EEH10256.1 predicted protein [Histoplasma capsulatum G186AR]
MCMNFDIFPQFMLVSTSSRSSSFFSMPLVESYRKSIPACLSHPIGCNISAKSRNKFSDAGFRQHSSCFPLRPLSALAPPSWSYAEPPSLISTRWLATAAGEAAFVIKPQLQHHRVIILDNKKPPAPAPVEILKMDRDR